MRKGLAIAIESQIEAGFICKNWGVFWPSQFAEALRVDEDEAQAVLTSLAELGKLLGKIEYRDEHGEAVWVCPLNSAESPEAIGARNQAKVESFDIYFELSPEWRDQLKKKSLQQEARLSSSSAEANLNRKR